MAVLTPVECVYKIPLLNLGFRVRRLGMEPTAPSYRTHLGAKCHVVRRWSRGRDGSYCSTPIITYSERQLYSFGQAPDGNYPANMVFDALGVCGQQLGAGLTAQARFSS